MRIVHQLPHRVVCHENVWIPMRDGARLAGRLWLPEDAERTPVPAILEYIPYRKRDITRGRDDRNHPYLAGHGYACIRVDLRGSGESDGVLKDQYLEQEQIDGIDVIRWLADQPWCDGSVGMFGISWGGFNALQIAARRPPALKAIITACSTDDLYVDNMHYMGGCLLTDNLSEATTMFAFNSCPPDPELVGSRWREMWLERLRGSGLWLDIWLRHQRRDDFWKPGSVSEDYGRIQCPVMAVSGWADGFSNAIFRLLQHLRVPRVGLIGPWSHKYPHMGIPGPPIGFLQESLRWFDRWLKNLPTGVEDDPLLRVWMQDSAPPQTQYAERPGRWVAERSWPSPRIQWQAYSLAPHRRLVPQAEADPSSVAHEEIPIQSPLTVGLFAGKWCSYAATPDLPSDQRLEDGGALVFETPPLREPLELLGQVTCHLELASNKPLAMIAARLGDVSADGQVTRVTYGLLNLTHRAGHAEPRPMPVGEFQRVTVQLNGIAQRFEAGHRLRLALSTSYFPLAWPSPEPAELQVRTGASQIELPVRPPDPDDEHLRPFPPPEGAPSTSRKVLEANRANWRVHHNLASGASTLDVVRDDGAWRVVPIEMTIRRRTREWYTSQGNNPSSARGETETLRSFRRDPWNVRIETRTLLTCDRQAFHLNAQLDAYEGERRIYAQTWNESILRDHV